MCDFLRSLFVKTVISGLAVAAAMYMILKDRVSQMEIIQISLIAMVVTGLLQNMMNEPFVTSDDAETIIQHRKSDHLFHL